MELALDSSHLAPSDSGTGSSHEVASSEPSRGAGDAGLGAVMAAVRGQEAALRQIQATLNQLLRSLPAVASLPGEANHDGALVAICDPMGAGFTLTQRAMAEALGVSPSYVSALVRAFKLDEDPHYALTVRPGVKRLVNYHPRAIERFRELVMNPPADLDKRAHHAVEQVRLKLR